MSLGMRDAPSAAAVPRSTARLALGYLELTKPRIVMLVMITGIPALLMASNGIPSASLFWGTLLGTTLAAGSAASFNMFFDRNVDGLMVRTAGRPIPSGLIPASHAVGLGFLLAAASWAVLMVLANLLAAVIAVASIFYYAVVYTAWLKRRTPQNIVIGGAAGASAPLIAWAAVTGEVGLPAILMAGIVFLWTPPHFWALALYRSEDYARANIPMLPVTHGEAETRRQIFAYSVILVPVTLALSVVGSAGPVYGVPAALLGAAFITQSVRVLRGSGTAAAVVMFRYSIIYLFVLFAALTLDGWGRAMGFWGA